MDFAPLGVRCRIDEAGRSRFHLFTSAPFSFHSLFCIRFQHLHLEDLYIPGGVFESTSRSRMIAATSIQVRLV